MKRHAEPAVIVNMAVRLMGSVAALANALQVDRRTVTRWRSGQGALSGTGLVAIMALIRHPEDFTQYKTETK